MTENLLHYIWLNRLFYPQDITTCNGGDAVEIINVGRRNSDAGPDFFNAQVRIGSTLWAGNVEIHISADDWYRHGHDRDAAYNNVILHVVLTPGKKPAITQSGREVPEIVLRFSDDICNRYDSIDKSLSVVRCAPFLKSLDKMSRNAWLDRLVVERIEKRCERVSTLFDDFNGDWDQVFFALLCRAMGFSVNAQPMEHLARVTPVSILVRHSDPFQMEALLLGQAGMLAGKPADDYMARLQKEYDFLRTKFSLSPIDASEWKRLRLRPGNFPIIRLSQIADVVGRIPGNFESVFSTFNTKVLLDKLDVSASDYWSSHYAFGTQSSRVQTKRLGLDGRRLVIINAVIPFLFACAKRKNDEHQMMNVVEMLRFMPIEHNHCLDDWAQCGVEALDEGEAQALLHLSSEYCQKRRCLNCRWGHRFLSRPQ